MRYLSIIIFTFIFITQAVAEDLRIVNIRVGQGDSTLIQGPPDATGKRINVLFDAGDIPDLDGGNILRAVLNKQGVKKLDYVIVSHDDADHIGGIAFGGRHGKSFILGFDNAVGCPGDDDGDGETDWLAGKKFISPDPDELGKCRDMIVENWVDYGEDNMRSTIAIQKYNGMANAMGKRITIADQSAVDSFEIDLGNGARMICFAANGYVCGMTARVANFLSGVFPVANNNRSTFFINVSPANSTKLGLPHSCCYRKAHYPGDRDCQPVVTFKDAQD